MNSRKRRERKQMLTLIIAAAIILALVITYFAVKAFTEEKEDDDPTLSDIGEVGSFTIIDEDYTLLTSLSYKYDGETVNLHVEDGRWVFDGDPDFPVNQETVVYMMQAVSDYGGFTRYVYDESRESSYGTDDPMFDITVTYFDKRDSESTHTRRFLVGNKNSLTGYYYFYEQGSTYIYMVNDMLFPYFAYKRADLFLGTVVPQPKVKDIVALKVEYDGGVYEYTAEDAGEETEPTVKAIMNSIPNTSHLDFDACVGYGLDKSEIAKYGLGEPSFRITLDYKEYTSVSASDGGSTAQMAKEKQFTVLFGDFVTEGEGDEAREYVYVCEEGSDIVYRVDADYCHGLQDAVSGE